MKLGKEDRFYEIKLQTLKSERLEQLEAAEKFDQKTKKSKKRTKLVYIVDRKSEALANQKVKSLIDLKSIPALLSRSLLKKVQKLIYPLVF